MIATQRGEAFEEHEQYFHVGLTPQSGGKHKSRIIRGQFPSHKACNTGTPTRSRRELLLKR